VICTSGITDSADPTAPGQAMRRLSSMAAADVHVDMRLIRGRQRSGLGVRLMIAIAWCGACDSRTPTRPSLTSSPSPSPPPSPPPVPVVPHNVVIWYYPDMWSTPAPRDSDGSYLLDWAAGWYCVWLQNIPSTPADYCREYTFTFSWPPGGLSGQTWSHGCQPTPTHSRAS
jgi:hypothetical protein